ncbi:hypothetical protein Bca4012_057502 [Brassica carinata]
MSFITSLSVFSLHLPLLLLSLFLNPVISDPRGETVAQMCNNRTMTPQQRSIVVTNFLAAMDAVSPLVEAKGYGQVVNGTGNLTVYAYGECMKDLDKKDCDSCFAQIKAKVPRCLPYQQITRGGRVFSDGCYISSLDLTNCSEKEITGVNRTLFQDNAAELVKFMSVEAVRNGGFYAGFVDRRNVTVHGLAQCWEPLSRSGCVDCLSIASEQIGSCLGKDEGRALNAGCYMRFSTQKFYNNSGNSTSDGNGGHNYLVVIFAVTCSVVAFLLFVSAIGFLYRKKRAKKQRVIGNLEKATDYFSDKNKLGQGGSGSVFKQGVLSNEVTWRQNMWYEVWSLYGTSNLVQVVDPVLGDNFNKMEASRLLEIGLLCVQAAFEQRPAMSAIVKMMKGNMEIPTPTQPPFLNPGNVVEVRKMMSPTMDSLMEDQSQSSGWRSDNISESFFEPR